MKTVSKLLRWYAKYGRTLPWRETTDPYRILVSEVMLQQTQVPRVLLFYKKWLKKYPGWKELAKALNADVIQEWAGLGYNRRALMLRDIARSIVENGVPESEVEWRALKGIGPYTAAALAVFSLRARSIPIDTNIRRVIGRLFLGKTYPQPSDDQRIQKVGMSELMNVKKFHDVPQALFDLATIHCTKIPDCANCPLVQDCKASKKFLSGRVKVPDQMIKKSRENIWRNKKYPDRIYRGRILKIVREQGRVDEKNIGELVDEKFERKFDQSWIEKMISRLEKDGMITIKKQTIFLTE